ncbi:hypothetical protein D3C80_1128680 [compost metagenome]
MQLVLKEAAHGVGQGNAVDQQDRKNGEEIQQGDQGAGLYPEMLLDHLGDVRPFTTGQDEAGQAAVRVVRHRERQQRQDQQRPETAKTCVDRQKQGSRTNRRAKQAQHPGGVMAIPAGEACWCRRFIAFINAIGLIIHPVGSPHSGHLPLGQDESEKADRQRPGRNRGAIVRD